jgi:hypothetical protein
MTLVLFRNQRMRTPKLSVTLMRTKTTKVPLPADETDLLAMIMRRENLRQRKNRMSNPLMGFADLVARNPLEAHSKRAKRVTLSLKKVKRGKMRMIQTLPTLVARLGRVAELLMRKKVLVAVVLVCESAQKDHVGLLTLPMRPKNSLMSLKI